MKAVGASGGRAREEVSPSRWADWGGGGGGLSPKKISIFKMTVERLRASSEVEICFSKTGLIVSRPVPGYG